MPSTKAKDKLIKDKTLLLKIITVENKSYKKRNNGVDTYFVFIILIVFRPLSLLRDVQSI